MHPTTTPLFATDCIGETIAYVHVLPTHIRYEQKHGRDISVPSHMIASVEERVYQNGFVILWTTSRRRIICMVRPKRAAVLCAAIRDAQNAS
jgi:hypothetical protein